MAYGHLTMVRIPSIETPAPAPSHQQHSQYIDLEKLVDANGIGAIISQRRGNGVITFKLFKEFDRDNRKEQTSFVPNSLIKPYKAMVEIVERRILELEANPKLLADLQAKAGGGPVRERR